MSFSGYTDGGEKSGKEKSTGSLSHESHDSDLSPTAHEFVDQLTRRERPALWWVPPGEWHSDWDGDVAGVLSGSFNPLHEGHLSLCQAAIERLGGVVAAELSIMNVEKPGLTADEVHRRCRQFTLHPVVVTAAATFVEKSRLIPGVTFIVGADTASRIVDPRFYQGDRSLMDDALSEIRRQGCSFLVAARHCQQRLLTLDQLAIPRYHRHLFQEIPPGDFRMDLSSTAIRGLG